MTARAHLSFALLGFSLLVGCGKTNSNVDTIGEGDGPRRGTGDEAEQAVPRPESDGGRGSDARVDASDGSAVDDDSATDDDSRAMDDDAEDDTEATPSTPTSGPPPSDPRDVGEATWDPEACHVPTVEVPSDPSGEVQWTLAREYCEVVEARGCLDDAAYGWHALENCSNEERLGACLHMVLEIHHANIAAECETLWSDAIACATESTWDGCAYSFDYPYGPPGTCPEKAEALLSCQAEHPNWREVEGSYTTCGYDTAVTNGCEVLCEVGRDDYATLSCSGPDGVPMRCSCAINGIPLNEGHIPVGTPDPIWVSDCEDAARQAADGLCTSRLDCCFAYHDGRSDVCMCGAIPERAGFDSCEALAASVMGQMVDICPQYEGVPSTCWPPPCN